MPIFLLLALFLTQSAEATYYSFTTDYPPVYDTFGTDWLSRLEVFSVFDGEGKSHEFERKGRRFKIQWKPESNLIQVFRDGKLLQTIDLLPVLQRAKAAKKPLTQTTLTEASGPLNVYFEDLSVEWKAAGAPKILHFKADLLYSEARSR